MPRRGTALLIANPDGAADVRDARALSLRAAVDPAAPLNDPDTPQSLTIQLTESPGNQASVTTRDV